MSWLKGFIKAAVGAAILFSWSALQAYIPPEPSPYQVVTGADEQFLFVMLPYCDALPSMFNGGGHCYPNSGLYRNDGSLTPMWTVDWYSFHVELSKNGRYLVGFDIDQRSEEIDTVALGFYEEGRLIKAYEIEDLVTDFVAYTYDLPNRWYWEAEFDGARQLLRVKTQARDTILFDITTGERLVVVPSQVLKITGKITRPKGHVQQVTDLRVCWADQLLIGTSASLEGTTLKLERIGAVRLGEVVHMERIRHITANRHLYRLWLKDTTARLLDFSDQKVSICGQTDDGRAVMLTLEEIVELEILDVSEQLEDKP